MAIHYAKLWLVVLPLLLCNPHVQCRNVTHEDIRDAMLSLVHMFRTSEDKLDRHEYREKALGDHLKKTLNVMDKRQRNLEPIKGTISRLDERLAIVETNVLQREEREKAAQKKTNEALDEIQKSLQSLTSFVTKNLKPVIEVPEENNLTVEEDSMSRRLDVTDAKLDAVKQEIENLKKSLSKESFRAVCLEMTSDVKPLERHISEAEKLLNKYELKLNELNNSTKVQTEFVPLNEVSLADEAWHSKMTEVMERQEKDIKQIHQLLSDAESVWKDLPRLGNLGQITNQTLEAMERVKENIKENDQKLVAELTAKLHEMDTQMQATNKDILANLTQSNTMNERTYGEITLSYDVLRAEIQTLSKNDIVMLQTSDNVVAIKKRIEYGVHQILVEVGELIKIQSKRLNKTLNERFDNVETTIVETHTNGLANLSAKIELEMSQVWRQIGIMYQQLVESKSALDKLTQQTEQYVNSSVSIMDTTKVKVGLITARMEEVDDSLNFLLGRLSLVTHEFNSIKTGLGEALDKVNSELVTVQSKIKDGGPGPHNITETVS